MKDYLDDLVYTYNRSTFIEEDPISVPHGFGKLQDIEIAGLFAAIFSWGRRKTVILKTRELMALMDQDPYRFVMEHTDRDLKPLSGFAHRTFCFTDLHHFIRQLRLHYSKNHSLETAFLSAGSTRKVEDGLNGFYELFFSDPDSPNRTRKHVPAPCKGSACKRLNMLLRWMVRKDSAGVDFGLWKGLVPSELIAILDVHVFTTCKHLGLLDKDRKVGWATAVELTERLKEFDPSDPVKYDFALFGLGRYHGSPPSSIS